MLNHLNIDDLAEKISNNMPSSLKVLQQDIDGHIKAALQSTLEKMDLVTREEFDIQAKLLERSREKLEQMEKRLAELEKNLTEK